MTPNTIRGTAVWFVSLVAGVGVAACQHGERVSSTSATAELSAPPSSPGARPTVTTGSYRKPPAAELEQRLSVLEYDVTQHAATEPPFRNSFWNNHAPGLYVDVVTGEPLFSSRDKFDSGTGWPSFSKPVDPSRVVAREDVTLGAARTEVRSKAGDSHLGHVFDDGPGPTGLRYCINSASLRFIPVKDLEKEGYKDYLPLFSGS